MDKILKIRIALVAFGIFLQALGVYLNVYSITRTITYSNGISLPESFYPYTLEALFLVVLGPFIYWFGYKYKEPIKGKKQLLKKIFLDWE